MSTGTSGVTRRVRRGIADSPAAPILRRGREMLRTVRRGAGRLLVRTGTAIAEPGEAVQAGREAQAGSWGSLPHRHTPRPKPREIGADWPDPPEVDRAGAAVQSIYDTGERPPVMDLALLESLNEEYRTKPLVPEPQSFDQDSREDRARRRILDVHRAIDLADKRTLELGCGAGFEVWYLSHHFGSDAWGVDVSERQAWATLADERTHFLMADIATDRSFEADYFDRVYSFAVLEHVVHPHALLTELYRIMKPGGLAYLSANLHRGPKASHIYREIFFPFPHLLFTDDVIREFRLKHHGRDAGASWVNRLTWSQYEDYLREIGFELRSLKFRETPLDEEFYKRFEHILGRYPRWDLTKDFFDAVVEKPRR
jgi:cyclopropane fatty-acyl-phospholipid synthase-like methyltransferase